MARQYWGHPVPPPRAMVVAETVVELGVVMIVRIYQAKVRPGGVDQLCELIKEKTWPLLAEADGFLGGEFYRSMPEPDRSVPEPDTVVLLTRWRDEAALAAWAGPLWRMRPVANPEDYQYLAETDRVQHFTVVETR